jgi:hypothetical protein
MVMVHFGPNPTPDTALGNVYGVSHGRASVLFALLAGVGVALLVGDRLRGWPSLARGRLVLRGTLLLPLGLWLQGLDHGALVILQYYAVYFLFAALVLTLSDRWLLAGGAAVLVGGPLVYLGGQMVVPEWFTADPATLGDPISKIADDLLLTGTYPLVTWAAPLLFGLWLGRQDLAAPAVRWGLLFLGLVVAVAAASAADWLTAAFSEAFEQPGGPGFAYYLLTDTPHDQMPLWPPAAARRPLEAAEARDGAGGVPQRRSVHAARRGRLHALAGDAPTWAARGRPRHAVVDDRASPPTYHWAA